MWIIDIPRLAFVRLGNYLLELQNREWYKAFYEKIKKLR
jgi:hypothetical protein